MATSINTLKMVSGNKRNFPMGYVFPPQKVSSSVKQTEEWQQACIDGIIGKSTQTVFNGRNSAYRKQVNYNLVNSLFDEGDLEYILDPYGINSRFNIPAKLQDFNIIRPKLERLKGEELIRPFNFMAIGLSGDIIRVRDEYKQKLFLESFNQMIQQELQSYGLAEPQTDEQGNPVQPKTPAQIEEYMNYSFKDVREKYANDIIQFLYRYRKLQSVFNKGWEHALIASEEIYYTGILGGHPIARCVNPINFDYDRVPDMEDIQDAQWCKEDRWMTIGQILDEYREYLSDSEIDMLEEGTIGMNLPNNSAVPGFAYSDRDIFNSAYFYNYSQTGSVNHIRVSTCCWKSMRKIGFFTYMDEETGEEDTIMVDDTFVAPKELKGKYKIEWQWINEVWIGDKIGAEIYVNIRPLPNQIKNPENPSECKLPYVGKIFNSLNSKATSIVDLLKPHQYTYIIIWDRLLMELAKSKGRVLLTDVAQLPKSQGFDVEKYMYYVDKGFAFINSMEEGREGDPSSRSAFNQFQSIDLTASNTIGTYINILQKLEDMAGELVGVNRQRQGDVQASEHVSNVNTSLQQSSLVTEYWFFKHNEVKEAVLTRLIELSKLCYNEGVKTQYFMEEGYTAFLNVDGELYNDSEYGVFVTNSSKDNKIKEELKGLAQAALQNDKLKFSDIIKIMKSDSISQIENTIKKGEVEQQQRMQEQQEADRQLQRDLQQQQIDAQKEERNYQSQEAQLDREGKIQEAQIKALGFSKDTDANNNQIPDVIEQGKLALEQTRLAYDQSLKERELLQKDKEINTKAAVEKYKADISYKVAKENKTKAELSKKSKK